MMPSCMRRSVAAILLVALPLLAACGDSGDGESPATTAATFAVRPGVEAVTVTAAPPKATLVLYDAAGKRVLGLITDDLGQAVFSYIPDQYLVFQTGQGTQLPTTQGRTLKRGTYTIRNESVRPIEVSAPFDVLGRDDHPPTSLYESQVLTTGFNYIEMRDGVQL